MRSRVLHLYENYAHLFNLVEMITLRWELKSHLLRRPWPAPSPNPSFQGPWRAFEDIRLSCWLGRPTWSMPSSPYLYSDLTLEQLLLVYGVTTECFSMIWHLSFTWWPCGPRRCHWLITVSHHCRGTNPIRGMWGSCQLLGVRWWFSPGTLRFPPSVTTG